VSFRARHLVNHALHPSGKRSNGALGRFSRAHIFYAFQTIGFCGSRKLT
jgi:hypothetical protein